MGKVSRDGLCHAYLRGTDEVTDGVPPFPCSFMRISPQVRGGARILTCALFDS